MTDSLSESLECSNGTDLNLSFVEVQLEVSDEIPSDDWTRDIGFDCCELVGFSSEPDLELLAAEALDLVPINSPEAYVRVRLISRIRLAGAYLLPGIDQDFCTPFVVKWGLVSTP